MLKLLGPQEGSEYEAGLRLRDLILEAMPEVATDNRYDVRIVVAAKCYGEEREDIDILLFAAFGRPYALSRSPERTQPVFVYSLCVAIEVKRHYPDSIRFTGNQLDVLYHGHFDNVSKQSMEQQVSVRRYIERQGIDAPYVNNLIWLLNVSGATLPQTGHNVLGGDATWLDIVERCTMLQGPRYSRLSPNTLEIRAPRDGRDSMFRRAFELFTFELQPSSLDRKKMEAVTTRLLVAQKYSTKLGEQLLIFRGRGGTGKTVNLLKLAHELYTNEAARVLILTYNRALVSDIRRVLALMSVKDDVAEESISIQTVHSFIYYVLVGLGIINPPCDDFLERYDQYKAEAIELLAAAQPGDISELIKSNNSAFSWDYIFIDEAQDWPADERDILFSIYDYRSFVLADGVDQLVRTHRHIDWREKVDRKNTQVVPLQSSLRLKSALCNFAQAFAHNIGLERWEMAPNLDIYGGHVIVLEGDYLKAESFNASLIEMNNSSGNKSVDMLYCVPPRLVRHSEHGNISSLLAERFEDWGLKAWDGAADETRETYPTDLDQLRIVQYDSCRGLEGWTVVCLELDQFYTYKVETYGPLPDETQDISFDARAAAHNFAVRWLMIPLTRAIDTLVVHVASLDSPVGAALRTAYQEASQEQDDLRIEWRRL